ncbi:MAG: DUF3419 family protein [Pseudomonadota bacterium]
MEEHQNAPSHAQPDGRSERNLRLTNAVQQSKVLSKTGLQERAFALLFRGLVYPQIWEDPVVDMEALELKPGDRVVTISSGGCNALSYLTADPGQVIAVDLSHAHVALTRLKQAGFRHLPGYHAFFRFFGEADNADSRRQYETHLAPHLDQETRSYWEGRTLLGRRRIRAFSNNIYEHGVLGKFIGASHLLGRLLGVRLSDMLSTRNIMEQRAYFEREIAPLFENRVVRWVTSNKASLFGLGIPPAQYDSLALAGGGNVALVLQQRLEKLLCGFPLSENYFAWQALARRYAPGDAGPLPPYLQKENFDQLQGSVDRLSVENASVTERLSREDDQSLDAFVLLDAQDWMTDVQLNDLWSEITRTAKSGARVIFRTADIPTLLPGRVHDETLNQWTYEAKLSERLGEEDRSGIYGGFHLYVRN